MNIIEKEAFRKVIEAFKENEKIYDSFYRNSYGAYTRTNRLNDREKFSAMELGDLACNHLFDDRPNFFGITEHEGHVIRAYFHNPRQHIIINELYRQFPDTFEGEAKDSILEKYLGKISKKVPLF